MRMAFVGTFARTNSCTTMPYPNQVLYAASCLTGTTESSTKKVSESMGNVTSHALPGFCLATISKARSMLSACIATLKRAVPLLTWTEILIISPHPLSALDRDDHYPSIILHGPH